MYTCFGYLIFFFLNTKLKFEINQTVAAMNYVHKKMSYSLTVSVTHPDTAISYILAQKNIIFC